MRFETSQHLRLSQQMKMSPRMIQSMEILQLAGPALEERIEQELESNIALDLVEPALDESVTAESQRQDDRDATEGERALNTDSANAGEGFDRLTRLTSEYRDVLDDQFGDSYQRVRRPDGEIDGKMQAMANTAARGESLHTQLLSQWSLAGVDERLGPAGEHLIGFIDDDGYIRAEMETILAQAPPGVTEELLNEALPLVQGVLEPVGIGARNLRECLLIQIDVLERENPGVDLVVERTLLMDHLTDIEQNRLPRIAEATGLSIEQVKAGLEGLRHLDPRPGRQLVSETPSVVIPDAIVEYDEEADAYVVMLFDGRLPRLRINPRYASMLKDEKVDKATKEFVDSNVRNARWLIEAIDLRCNTLLRVVRVVVAHQRDFFDQGPASLKPLPMSQVAEQLGVHVATISRAVSGKWIQTPRGVLPLRRFFSAGTETEGGEDMSWDAVRQTLKEIIEAEDRSEPLGDDKLAAALKERGINIARRTVAKYRDQLGIPSAKLRKVF